MRKGYTTWRNKLAEAFADNHDDWALIEGMTLTDADLDQEFDPGYGSAEGCPFTVWTAKFVYFPWVYDGAEGVESVPRHPNGEAKGHVGGQ